MNRCGTRLLLIGVLAGLLTTASGCLNCFFPVPAPPPETAGPCQALPAFVRHHVHVFMMNGVDPFGVGNLSGVRDHVLALGFTQIYYGQLYHRGWFEEQIERIQKEDPEGRIVLIGYGAGAKSLGTLAQKMTAAGATIDVLLALDASPDELPGGENYPVQELGAPTCPETMPQVAAALAHCASRVTIVAPPVPELPETAPMPRPLVPLAPQSFGSDWDKLKLATQLP